MAERTVEDRLREEYFKLLPDIRFASEQLETKIRHCVLPVSRRPDKHEQVIVTSRIKDCESAIDALCRDKEVRKFNQEQPDLYTLTDLKDLAGVRVLVFPEARLHELNATLAEQFSDWVPNHVMDAEESGDPLAFTYYGRLDAVTNVFAEFQVVSMLIGQFWDVEHSVMYKPSPQYRGVARSLEMQECTHNVYRALKEFEKTFEKLIESP